jgi:hypothetical protein
MKKLLGAGLLALLCVAPAKANFFCGGCCPPWKFEMGGNFYIRCYQGTACGGVLGPWYNYWPLEAHFNVPAPCAYPFWPPGQTLPNGQTAAIPPALGGHAPPPAALGPPALTVPSPGPMGLPPGVAPTPGGLKPANFHAPAVQPVQYSAPAPSYWYGR